MDEASKEKAREKVRENIEICHKHEIFGFHVVASLFPDPLQMRVKTLMFTLLCPINAITLSFCF